MNVFTPNISIVRLNKQATAPFELKALSTMVNPGLFCTIDHLNKKLEMYWDITALSDFNIENELNIVCRNIVFYKENKRGVILIKKIHRKRIKNRV